MPAEHRTLRVALAQLNYRVGDLDGNAAAIEAAVERARDADADLVVCSELSLLGYPPDDLLTRETFLAAQREALDRVAALTDDDLGLVVGVADRNPHATGKPLYNAAAVCHGGAVAGTTHKRLLPTYDVFDENRYFEPADGAPVHELDGVRVGVSICEDAWNEPDVWERPLYAADPIEDLADDGVDLLVNLSASPFALGKPAFRTDLMASHAADHETPLVFVNQVGGNDELLFDGRSLVAGPDGEVAARLPAFEEAVAVHDVPLDGRTVPADERALAPDPATPAAQARRAIVVGLRDYVRKSGFEQVVLGLSGGIDSSVAAALAADALGPENVLGVAMPTRYTSDASRTDARRVADALGIDFLDLPIDATFQAFLDHLAPAFAGHGPDETEENLQARVRGTTLMALANKFDRLALATGNKTELAVGYCTLYGDMAGALAPLADCPKSLVYALADRVNATADADADAPIPRRVVDRPPSAELRADQTDEDDLPPYDTLDAIVTAYVAHGRTPADIVADGHDPATVRRVLRMLHGSEFKRRQAAPVLKLTEKAFGVGWRYPLAANYRPLTEFEE